MMQESEPVTQRTRPLTLMTSWCDFVVQLAAISRVAPPEGLCGDPMVSDWADMPRRAWSWMWVFSPGTEARRAAFLLGKAALMIQRYASARGVAKRSAPADPVHAAMYEIHQILFDVKKEAARIGGCTGNPKEFLFQGEDMYIMYRTTKGFAEALDRAGPRTDVTEMALASTPREALYTVTATEVQRFVDLILEMGAR